MDYRFPDFYYEFRCKADKCEHSCCKGWEISIDFDTADRYKNIPGEKGREICSHLKFDEDGAEMILTEDEKCPFLLENGLCRMICDYGKDYISDICAEHPRFYNTFLNVTETGLGLSCEAVTQILLGLDDDLEIITSVDDSEICAEYDADLELADSFRQECDEFLYNYDGPVLYASVGLVKMFEESFEMPQSLQLADMFMSLEIMDNRWTRILRAIAENNPDIYAGCEIMNDLQFKNILRYLLYRNIPAAQSRKDCIKILKIMVCGIGLMAAAELTGVELEEAVRLFSAEIEYSDCNIDMLKLHI